MNNYNNPTITVLMPVYNCELYIKEALESILNQTYADFEFLIIDDASTDKTVCIIKTYNDSRIKLIEKPRNTGYTNSLNYGLTLAKGKYIARMDGDDISLPERFAKQVTFLDANPDVVLCGTLYQIIGTKNICNHPLKHEEIKVKLISGCYIAHPTVMFHKSVFESYELQYDPNTEPAEDYDLWARLIFLGKIVNIKEVLLYYRVHLKQTSILFNEKQKKISQDISIRMLEKIIPFLDRQVYFFDLQTNVSEIRKIITKTGMKWNLLNSLASINNKKVIYDKKIFLEFINDEIKSLSKLFIQKPEVYSLITVVYILNHFPGFFKSIGFKESIKFCIRSIFGKKYHFTKIKKKLKLFLENQIHLIRFKLIQLKNRPFNKVIRRQNADYKSIPIIIISFNQLYYLEKLIDFLIKNNYNNIVIIDNNSTYKPLLEYFIKIESIATIHRLKENHGHLVFWKNKDLFEKYSKGYYVVTDADIVPDENCPDDFLKYFMRLLNRYPKFTKVGFSLKIDDIPESNKSKLKILKWEKNFWKSKIATGDFNADIDTTFALYKPGFIDYKSKQFYSAIRSKPPYIASHGGWYVDNNNLNHEQEYYLETANKSASWLTDKNGNMTNKLYQ